MESDPLTPVRPIWLWPESDGVRLWTPDETHLYTGVAVDDPIALRRATRDGRTQHRLEKVLRPGALAERLASLLRTPGPRPLIYLANGPDQDLPLQDLPFESLWLDGRPLGDLATFCRHVRLDTAPTYAAPERELVIADLWPRPGPGGRRPLAGLLDRHDHRPAIRILSGPLAVEAFLRGTDPANYAALVVFCHGAEHDDPSGSPFIGPDGQSWDLLIDNGLPPLVILLACGSDGGNLVRYGRELLGHGARTLIASFGCLDAQAARGFLDNFLPRWLAGWRADAALQIAQGADETGWGARRLVLVGAPDLRRSDTPLIAEARDEELADIARRGEHRGSMAIAQLAERFTLAGFQRGRGLWEAEKSLRAALWITQGDEIGERWLFERLDETVRLGQMGRLTQAWLYPWLAQGAERFQHERMAHYEGAWRRLGEAVGWAPPSVHHYWHRTAYRRGRYGEALAELVNGLVALGADEFWPEGAALGRDLANLLIELDVPKAAEGVARALLAQLGAMAYSEAIQTECHKLGDTLARACVRGGGDGWRAALALLQRKRADARRHYGQDGRRELAALLHIASWGDPESRLTLDLAAEAREILANTGDTLAAIRHNQGNSTDLYLLRAFAAWVWRSPTKADADLVWQFRRLWLEDFYDRLDPGPIGCISAYLNLYARTGDHRLPADLPSWPAGREMLLAGRYFLEVAIFDALLGGNEEAAVALGHFHLQGETFLENLNRLPSQTSALGLLSLGPGDLTESVRELNQRRHQESSLITEGAVPGPTELLVQGLIPL